MDAKRNADRVQRWGTRSGARYWECGKPSLHARCMHVKPGCRTYPGAVIVNECRANVRKVLFDQARGPGGELYSPTEGKQESLGGE